MFGVSWVFLFFFFFFDCRGFLAEGFLPTISALNFCFRVICVIDFSTVYLFRHSLPETILSLLFVPILKSGKLISGRCWQKEGMLWLELLLFIWQVMNHSTVLLYCVELIKFHPPDNS